MNYFKHKYQASFDTSRLRDSRLRLIKRSVYDKDFKQTKRYLKTLFAQCSYDAPAHKKIFDACAI